MAEKVYIWGFPGIGKSTIQSDSLTIVDADCKQFQYESLSGSPTNLHNDQHRAETIPSLDYPQNYYQYVFSIDADLVLLNCHISLLEHFNKEQLLLVYPSLDLKSEYLNRYAMRSDHDSFLRYMDESFEDIIHVIKHSPYRTYEISEPNTYLQTLLDGGILMSQFMTKQELTLLFDDCMKLGIYAPAPANIGKTAAEHAQMLFEGELDVTIEELKAVLDFKKAELAEAERLNERRGGLSHDELKEKVLQGIVNGALSIDHGEISPYAYGYEVTFGPDSRNYINRWECYCKFPEVAASIVNMIEQNMQSREVFSSRQIEPLDIQSLLNVIERKEQEKITSFVEESKSGLERRGRYTGHVANLHDVHSGKALDGIILGHFCGDYSTITTSTQNDTLRALVAMKGFCLDCINYLERPYQDFVIDYLKAHGTDISSPEKLSAWIKANPEKCGLLKNRARKPSLSGQIEEASAKTSKSVLNNDAKGKEYTR